MRARKKAFTLVEVLVASTIGAFIALVAMGALKAISLSSEMTHNSIDSASEVRFAMNMIARDLMNFYRDKNTGNTKLVGKIQESGQKRTSIVALYTISRTKARFEQPEGDVYEVEYILVKDEDKSILYRRYWPNPDRDTNPGGIVTAIARNIDIFEVRYFNGDEWSDEWPEDMERVPALVEVNIGAVPLKQSVPIAESFTVSFARYPQVRAETTDGGIENENVNVERGDQDLQPQR